MVYYICLPLYFCFNADCMCSCLCFCVYTHIAQLSVIFIFNICPFKNVQCTLLSLFEHPAEGQTLWGRGVTSVDGHLMALLNLKDVLTWHCMDVLVFVCIHACKKNVHLGVSQGKIVCQWMDLALSFNVFVLLNVLAWACVFASLCAGTESFHNNDILLLDMRN